MRQPRIYLNIALSKEYGVMLDRMAPEAGVTRSALATSMLKSVLEDDARAHREAETTQGNIGEGNALNH